MTKVAVIITGTVQR